MGRIAQQALSPPNFEILLSSLVSKDPKPVAVGQLLRKLIYIVSILDINCRFTFGELNLYQKLAK